MQLMGCLAFVGRLERSPYSSLFDDAEWERLAESVSRYKRTRTYVYNVSKKNIHKINFKITP